MFWNKKKYTNGYSTVSVNGKTVRVRGNSISIINDQIIVDGKLLEETHLTILTLQLLLRVIAGA